MGDIDSIPQTEEVRNQGSLGEQENIIPTSHKKYWIIGVTLGVILIAVLLFVFIDNPLFGSSEEDIGPNIGGVGKGATGADESDNDFVSDDEGIGEVSDVVDINDSSDDGGINVTEDDSVNPENILNLGITLSKSTYEIGETVVGDYTLDYDGETFEGLVIYTFSRAVCPEKHYALARGNIETGSFSDGTLSILKLSFKAFRNDKVGSLCSYVGWTDYFYEEGTYTYGISVYDCSYVETQLSEDCSASLDVEEVIGLTPIKFVSKDVIVSGGVNQSVPECSFSSDCIEVCEGCDSGTQICEEGSGVCMDCFISLQCIDGYTCQDNECVLE